MPYENYGDAQDTQMASNWTDGSSYSAQAQQYPQSMNSGGILGSIVGGITDLFTHAETNANNAAAALQNRQWQEWMSSTGHRREVADMKAAGLNPILSATGGGGAPMGSAPPIPQTPPADSAMSTALGAIREFRGTNDTNSQMALRDAQYNVALEQKDNIFESTNTERTQQKLNDAAAAKAQQDARFSAKQTEIQELERKRLESWLPAEQSRAHVEGIGYGRLEKGATNIDKGLETLFNVVPKMTKDLGTGIGNRVYDWAKENFPGAFSNPSSAAGGAK